MSGTATKKKITTRPLTTDIKPPADIHPVLWRIYQARGVSDIDDLQRDLPALLGFNNLVGIDQAVQILANAIRTNERMLIVGDFDADGATSCAVAILALRALGAKQVDYIVPNRFEYGYGLTPEIVDVAAEQRPDIIITVDNGIASCAGVERAKDYGFKVVITDHHLAGEQLPQADAIVNPNLPNDDFASKNLAGVGVIFYVMLALRAHLREQHYFTDKNPQPNLAELLDLVALGTVADVVPLDKNNRIIVHQGLQRIRARHCRPGISALLTVAGRDGKVVTATDLAFLIAPRLNAAGRLDDMSHGIECLLTSDAAEAKKYALELDKLNRERRDIEADMKAQAFAHIDELFQSLSAENLPYSICLYRDDWHQGIVGLLAGRIKEKFHRPTIIFADVGDGELKGSARSIPALHIRDTLEQIALAHPDILTKFGGHAMAAGLSLDKANFTAFQQAFEHAVQQQLSSDQLQDELLTDGQLRDEEIVLSLAEQIQQAGPWGQNFPAPLFDNEFFIVEQRLLKEKHLKMVVTNKDETHYWDAIAFNIDVERWSQATTKVRLVYRLDVNEFRNRRNVQLMVEYIEAI